VTVTTQTFTGPNGTVFHHTAGYSDMCTSRPRSVSHRSKSRSTTLIAFVVHVTIERRERALREPAAGGELVEQKRPGG